MFAYQIATLARKMISDHGLDSEGWGFKWDTATRRLGCCNYQQKLITLSRKLSVLAPDEVVRNTILHEIAHALVGPGQGHNATWKEKAREIGCTAERCHSVDTSPLAKYVADCGCGVAYHKRHRKPRGIYSCRRCGTNPLRWRRAEG